MSELTIPSASPFDALKLPGDRWSARDLQPMLGYEKWDNFVHCIEDARMAASIVGAEDQFADAGKMIEAGKGARRMVKDVELTRYACYMVAMSCDGRKPEVATAKTYFAIKTREAEVRPHALHGPELIAAALIESQKMLEAREVRIHQLEAKTTEDAPKVSYVDTYVADEDLISFSTVASTANITEKSLRELLIGRDWIYVQEESRWSDSKNKKVVRYRYSEKADKKRYFRRVETHEAPRFRGEVMHTLKITPAGAEAVARLVAKAVAA